MDTTLPGGRSPASAPAVPTAWRHARRAWLVVASAVLLATGPVAAADASPMAAASPPPGTGSASDEPIGQRAPVQQPDRDEQPAGPPEDAIVHFHSRPDLRPPIVTVEAADAEASGHLFITPRFGGEGEGVMIMDGHGRLVWLHRVPGRSAVALKPFTYSGEPALSWWEGTVERGLGDGEFVIAGADYRELARIRAVRQPADLHELLVTPEQTAYLFAMDLIELDGQAVDDMLVQQVDIATGQLLWEWRGSDHIATEESVEPVPDEGPWDYLHFNSIDRLPNGDLLLSARHTDAIYRVSRQSGDIVWRLGGKRSDFAMAKGATFHKQHDARWLGNGAISLFDNSTKEADDPAARPRGIVLSIDEGAGTAELVRELLPPRRVDSSSQGNVAIADDGSATIGWGSGNLVTGYDADGQVTWDAAMPAGFSSYRAFRAGWHGQPSDDPLVSVEAEEPGAVTAWVSWNGATEVAAWELLAGSAGGLDRVRTVPAVGFETALEVPDRAAVIAITALDADGTALGRSAEVDVRSALAGPVSADRGLPGARSQ